MIINIVMHNLIPADNSDFADQVCEHRNLREIDQATVICYLRESAESAGNKEKESHAIIKKMLTK